MFYCQKVSALYLSKKFGHYVVFAGLSFKNPSRGGGYQGRNILSTFQSQFSQRDTFVRAIWIWLFVLDWLLSVGSILRVVARAEFRDMLD